MASRTTRMTITAANYVEVTQAGDYNFFIKPLSAAGIRLHVGQTPPASDTVNFLPISSAPFSLGDLDSTDRVYLRAEVSDADVVLIVG